MGDGTGIDDRNVRPFFKRDEGIPSLFQGIDESFRFKLIYFAAKCSNRNVVIFNIISSTGLENPVYRD